MRKTRAELHFIPVSLQLFRFLVLVSPLSCMFFNSLSLSLTHPFSFFVGTRSFSMSFLSLTKEEEENETRRPLSLHRKASKT